MNSNKYYTYDLSTLGDERGNLIVLEENHNIPFDVKRVYYIFNTKKEVVRGMHAHKELQQVLICVNGSCKIKIDDGSIENIIELYNADTALYIGTHIWHEMFDFSQGSVLLVIASDYYNEDDYLRHYDEFLSWIKK